MRQNDTAAIPQKTGKATAFGHSGACVAPRLENRLPLNARPPLPTLAAMLESLEGRPAHTAPSIPAQFLKAFRFMLLSRVLDDKMAGLYRAGKIHGGVFLGRGQEALSASIGLALRKGDVFAPLIRDGAGRLAFGEPILDAV